MVSALGTEFEQDIKPPLYGPVHSERETRAEAGGEASSAMARKDLRQGDQRREETPGQQGGAQAQQLESGCRGSVASTCSVHEQVWKAEPRGSRGQQKCS